MTSTALGHALVRDYLDELDAAFAALPPERARELREQITAHLEDALPAAAGDEEVAEVLRRLGRPADLAAEARVPGGSAEQAVPPVLVPPPPPVVHWPGAHRRRFSVRRLRWRGWTVFALVVVLLAGAGDLIAVAAHRHAFEAAPTLQGPGASSWWGPDRTRAVVTDEITGESVSAAPGRWGQQQGFVVTVTNPSHWTQTILGPVPYMPTPGGVINFRIGISGTDPFGPGAPAFPTGLHFSSLPGSIPPHESRALRVLWTTTTCQDQGAHTVIYSLELRVRVGWVTRTEVVPLSPYFTLNGASPQRYCRG